MMLVYVLNQYPKTSHSFIRREIRELERQGWQVRCFALRRSKEPLPDPADQDEAQRTCYLLGEHAAGTALRLAVAGLVLLTRHPRRFLRAAMHALRLGWRAQRPLAYHLVYLLEACQLARLLRDVGGRHLHAHFGTNAAEVAMLGAMLVRLPYSFTVHGPEEFDDAGGWKLAEKIRPAAFAVAVSSYGLSQLYRILPHGEWGKLRLVRCGVDASYGATQAAPLPHAPRLVCVGRLCPQKAQLLLVEAVARLRVVGVSMQLVLAGDGELREALRAQVARLGVHDSVRITGWLSGKEVRAEILAARALVLPSFAEGLPVVLMEAMALGRPVVSTYIAGIPELVMPGWNGWLVPAGDLDALTRALEDVCRTPLADMARMGGRGRDIVLRRHDLAHEVRELGCHFERSIAIGSPS